MRLCRGIAEKVAAEMGRQSTGGRGWFPWLSPREDSKVRAEVRPEPQPEPVKRQAFAEWGGGIENGRGTVTSDNGGLLKMPYSLGSQLAGIPGTDPQELFAAIHAASFCMALVAELSARQIKPRSVHTTATVTLEKQTQDLRPTKLQLDVTAWIPGADHMHFERATESAREFWQRSLPFNGKLTVNASLNAW